MNSTGSKTDPTLNTVLCTRSITCNMQLCCVLFAFLSLVYAIPVLNRCNEPQHGCPNVDARGIQTSTVVEPSSLTL